MLFDASQLSECLVAFAYILLFHGHAVNERESVPRGPKKLHIEYIEIDDITGDTRPSLWAHFCILKIGKSKENK